MWWKQRSRGFEPGDGVLDVGTGSGAIAITLALETQARVLAADIFNRRAAGRGRERKLLSARRDFLACDLVDRVADRSIDVLVSNPPYVPRGRAGLQREVRDWEPHVALFAGPTGLEIYERLIDQAARFCAPAAGSCSNSATIRWDRSATCFPLIGPILKCGTTSPEPPA